MDNRSNNLEDLYRIINTYQNDMVVGERLELIISPDRNNPNKRLITIGLIGGLSRDRKTFIVEDGYKFDNQILVNLMNYYSKDDPFLSDKKLILTTLQNQTSKAVYETESGNLLYLETFNNNLFDRLQNNTKEESKTFETVKLSQEQKDWEEIIYYAKERRIKEDYIKRSGIDSLNILNINYLLKMLSRNKKFVPGYSKNKLPIVIENLDKLISAEEWKDELIEIGIDSDTYERAKEILTEYLPSQILGTTLTEKFAKIIQAEKRIIEYALKRKKQGNFQEEDFFEKIEFATSELEKVGYFDLKNASIESFLKYSETKDFGNSLPNAVLKLKKRYIDKKDIMVKENGRSEQYITYCDELLAYLETNALKNEVRRRKEITKKLDIEMSQHEESINLVNDKTKFEDLIDKIDLCKNARVEEENFEIIIEHDSENKNKRVVRVSLTNGMTRRDEFKYIFENKEEFDKKIPIIIEKVSENDQIIEKTKNNNEPVLLKTKEGNEILIKLATEYKFEKEEIKPVIEFEENIDKLNLTKEDLELIDYFRLSILKDNKQLPPVGINEIERLASINIRVKELEDAKKLVQEKTLSKSTLEKIETTYKAQLSTAIKNKKGAKEKKVSPPLISPKIKKELNVDDKQLAEYFKLSILREREQLPPVGINEIERLANINERVKELENAKKLVQEGTLSKSTLEKIETTYRAQLAKSFKEQHYNEEKITPPLISPKNKASLNLDEETRQLAEYFKYEILRSKRQLTDNNIKRIEQLCKINEKNSALEAAHNRLENKELTQQEFDMIHDSYREHLARNIKNSPKLSPLFNNIQSNSPQNEKNEPTIELPKDSNDKEKNKDIGQLEKALLQVITNKLSQKEPEIKQEKTEFDKLHDLFSKYKIKNVDGMIKIFNRQNEEEYITNEKEKNQIIFSHFWEVSTGLKSAPNDLVLGEKYAFNNDSRNLFNIMNIQYKESLLRNIPIDYESLKSHFEGTHHEKATEIYERLFGNPYNREFILNYYETDLDLIDKKTVQKNEIEDQVEEKETQIIEEEIKELKKIVKKEDIEDLLTEKYLEENKITSEEEIPEQEYNDPDFLDNLEERINNLLNFKEQIQNKKEEPSINAIEIRDAYEVAAENATIEEPASLKIFFPKETEQVEIIISKGQGSDEEVIYQKEFSQEEVMEDLLEEICNVYIQENSMTYNQTFSVPNTNRAGSITLGENDNVLQMSNAPKECVDKLQKSLEKSFNSSKKSTSKLKI